MLPPVGSVERIMLDLESLGVTFFTGIFFSHSEVSDANIGIIANVLC